MALQTPQPWMADDIKERAIDLLTPVYNMLDPTPQGRDAWYAKLGLRGRSALAAALRFNLGGVA